MPYTSAVLILRHPERELGFQIFGDEPLIIELDLGRGFDVTHPNEADQDTVIEWVADVRTSVEEAGVDEDDPLFLAVENALHDVMDLYGLVDVDADGEPIDTGMSENVYLCPECKTVTLGRVNIANESECPVCGTLFDEDDLTDDEEVDDGD